MLVLAMIVRDEAHVVSRAVRSVIPFIDAACIVDTGSTDSTVDVLLSELSGIPTQIHRAEWRDFGWNRSQCLELARQMGPGYALMVDADDTVAFDPEFSGGGLSDDGYTVDVQCGNLTYRQLHLFANEKQWKFVGATHEYAVCDEPHTVGHLDELNYVIGTDGQRRVSGRKSIEDLVLLCEEMRRNPHSARPVFYAARTARELGRRGQAISLFSKRTQMGGWSQEIYCSWLEMGRLFDDVVARRSAFLNAVNTDPRRPEAYYELARDSRISGQHQLAWMFCRQTIGMAMVDDGLFVETDVYDWKMADEISLALLNTNNHVAASQVISKLIEGDRTPSEQLSRLRRNLELCSANN